MKKHLTKSPTKRPTSGKRKRSSFSKGALGAGMAFASLGILVIVAAAAMMVGNIFPNGRSPNAGQPVVLIQATPEAAKGNLQLYHFRGATYTPTPTPTPIPPTDDPNEPKSPDPGNSSPDSRLNKFFPW